MKKEDFLLLLLVLLLLAAAALTLLFGGARSRHGGYGRLPGPESKARAAVAMQVKGIAARPAPIMRQALSGLPA